MEKLFLRDTQLETSDGMIAVREFYNDKGVFIQELKKEDDGMAVKYEAFISKEVILALELTKYLYLFYETNYTHKEKV